MAHKSDRRLYLDAEGKVVEADDPSRAQLLVSKGGEIPMEDARRYGLVGDAQEAPTAPQQPAEQREAGTPPEAAADVAASGRGRGRAATGQAGDAD